MAKQTKKIVSKGITGILSMLSFFLGLTTQVFAKADDPNCANMKKGEIRSCPMNKAQQNGDKSKWTGTCVEKGNQDSYKSPYSGEWVGASKRWGCEVVPPPQPKSPKK